MINIPFTQHMWHRLESLCYCLFGRERLEMKNLANSGHNHPCSE